MRARASGVSASKAQNDHGRGVDARAKPKPSANSARTPSISMIFVASENNSSVRVSNLPMSACGSPSFILTLSSGVEIDLGRCFSGQFGVVGEFGQRETISSKRAPAGVHIRRALQIHKRLSFARIENKNLYRVLDAIKVGIILIDEKRVVLCQSARTAIAGAQ